MTRRFQHLLLLALLPAVSGCATGYAQDWFRQRSTIITPQLLRYGLDLPQSRCVAERLGRRLSRSDLARLEERAIRVQPSGPNPLTLANLRAVAMASGGRAVEGELTSSAEACQVAVAAAAPAPVAAPVGAELAGATASPPADAPSVAAVSADAQSSADAPQTPRPFEGTYVQLPPGSAVAAMAIRESPGGPPSVTALPTTWLNLGAAASGQSIAIDAGSIQQEGAARTAWFRMTDANTGTRTGNTYRLRIDCSARTVQPLAMRQVDGQGAVTMSREYRAEDPDTVPAPAESGTVLEIAYLSMCT